MGLAAYVIAKVPLGQGAIMLSAMVASFLLNSLVKYAVKRERPSELDRFSLRFHVGVQKLSFPSCHVQLGFTAVALVQGFYPPLFALALVLALITAIARLAIGRHWFSDIIGGALIGYVFGWAFALFFLSHEILS
jgi:undecaprenyl-diphosphatase